MSINPRKASGPDGIPAWLLKENADLLSDKSDIINSSFAERRLPPSWKSADTVPIPKQKPIKDVNKHLRPILLTSILSKVAEEFVVADYLRPSILKKIGDNQFGAIPKSSTTHALISMVHSWAKHTDGTGSTVKVVLFDYRKAFDLIDHALLAGKLLALDIPVGVSFCHRLPYRSYAESQVGRRLPVRMEECTGRGASGNQARAVAVYSYDRRHQHQQYESVEIRG